MYIANLIFLYGFAVQLQSAGYYGIEGQSKIINNNAWRLIYCINNDYLIYTLKNLKNIYIQTCDTFATRFSHKQKQSPCNHKYIIDNFENVIWAKTTLQKK